MTNWNAVKCPSCGEDMPSGVVRCRYCHATLASETVGSQLDDSPLADAAHRPTTDTHDEREDATKTSTSDRLVQEMSLSTELDDLLTPPRRQSANASVDSSTAPQSQKTRKSGAVHSSETRRDPSSINPKAPNDIARQTRLRDAPVTKSDSKSRHAATDIGTQPADAPSPDQINETPQFSWPPAESRSGQLSRIALWTTVFLLAAPLCVSGPIPGSGSYLSFGLPMVHSGDEPHNLVLINSLISDGDLDVANNYANVHSGGNQAGRKFAGWALDHHVSWWWRTHLIRWWQAYEMDHSRWDKDTAGHPIPTLQKESIHKPVSSREYSTHSPGLAFILAPFLVAFRNTALVEPMALLCCTLATIAGLFAFIDLARPYARGPIPLIVAASTAYLGSPLWHYGRSLYAESFLAFFSVAAYAAVLRHNRYLTAGLLIGAGVLLKIPFALFAVPLIVEALTRRKWEDAFRCAMPILFAFAIVLFWNRQMHGEWLKFPEKFAWGYVLEGVLGLALSWQHGLLLFSPAVLLTIVTYPAWSQRHHRDAILMTAATLLYFGVIASMPQWWGGACYSARLILPVIPFLFAPFVLLFDMPIWHQDWRVRWSTAALIVVSIAFGAVGGFGCENVWGKHPLQLMVW